MITICETLPLVPS